MTECTASQFLESGRADYVKVSIPQMRIALRAEDYGGAARLWAGFEDSYRAKDMARMAATLAFLAFPDLRTVESIEVAA